MQAIQTKYHEPTNNRDARITARCAGGSVIMPYADELDIDGNHRKAAECLAAKMNWNWDSIESGTLKDGSFVHVLAVCR